MARLRPDPVRRPLLEARRRQREDVEQRLAVRADAAERDDVVRERLGRQRIDDRASASEERIGWVQQLAEITAPHRRSRHRCRGCRRVAAPDPLFTPEEKQLVAIGVEAAGQQHGSTEVESPLIEAVRVGTVRQSCIAAAISLPLIRVEGGVAVVLEAVAVELLCAALGDEPNLACRGAPVLRAVIRRQDLHFLDGVDVLRTEHRSRGARPRRDRAVDRHEVLVGARAVDAEAAVRHAVGIEGADGAASHARLQRREEDRVPSVQRQLLNLARLDRACDLRRRRLNKTRPGCHGDRFFEAAELQLRVDGDLAGSAQTDAGLGEFLEALQLDGDRVAADRHVRYDVKPGRIRDGGALAPGPFVGHRHRGAGQSALLRVADEA